MNTCPKCGKEIPEGTTSCPECGSDLNVRPVRAVPNISRREPDPLPERPGSDKGSSSGILSKVILLLAAALILFLVVRFMR